jgi:branched-subunit amino acid transport protein
VNDGVFDDFPLILAVAAVTYLTRVAGFALAGRQTPPLLDRFLRLVPVAAFAALAAPGIALGSSPGPRLLAATVAAAATVFTKRLEVGLLAGMAAFLGLRLVVGL